jgi:hypothetical protein
VGGRVCSIHSCHKVICNFIVNAPLSLYLHFITGENGVEHMRHLIARFYPILGFPGYILYLFVEGLFFFSFLSFLYFNNFIISSIKLETSGIGSKKVICII